MQFLTIAFAALASAAVVERGNPPAYGNPKPTSTWGHSSPPASTGTPPSTGTPAHGGLADVCPGIDQPYCCKTDVLGVADLSCDYPSRGVNTFDAFQKDCASRSEQAKCCTLSLGGLASLLCDDIPRK